MKELSANIITVPERDLDSNANSLSQKTVTQFWLYIFVVMIVTGLTLAAYQPTLFNFLISDDFSMISRLEASKNNDSPILQHFYGSWMGEGYYYRPLASCMMATEYLIWGAKGYYFRFANITLLLLTSLVIGLIIFEIDKQSYGMRDEPSQRTLVWAILSGALFALYPLHCEPMNWCICQHDAFATCFSLLGLWCYVRWRCEATKPFLAFSLLCTILGMLFKETAVLLPFVIYSYELLCGISTVDMLNGNTATLSSKVMAVAARFKQVTIVTLPYWLILSIYLCVRKAVLGALISYPPVPNSAGPSETIKTWMAQSVGRIFIPINVYVFSKSNPISIIWVVAIVLALGLSILAFKFQRKKRLGIFFLTWFILSLLPVCPIFRILPSLGEARLAYLSTVPICMILTYGFSRFCFTHKYSKSIRIVGILLIIFSSFILFCNNRAYGSMGHLSNRLLADLQRYYCSVSGDPELRILGLPSEGLTAFGNGMTKTPFLKRDIFNCCILISNVLNVNSAPFGILKESIERKADSTTYLYWDKSCQNLKPVVFYSRIPAEMQTWEGDGLRSIVNVIGNSSTKASWETGNILHVVSAKPPCLDLNVEGLPCWPTDFMQFRVQILSRTSEKSSYQFDLRFLNNIGPNYSWKEYSTWVVFSRLNVVPAGREQTLIFPLRHFPDWAMGGKCHGMRLSLPPRCDIKLISISIPETKSIIPIVDGPSIFQLNCSNDHQLIHYDASCLPGCTDVALEVVGPGQDFEKLYSSTADKNALLEIKVPGSAGTLQIQRSFFPTATTGTYKARVRALDKNGQQVGLCGDHFLIDVKE